MSTNEILAELPNLKPEDRLEVFRRLCDLQELDVVNGVSPPDEELKLLDQELADFERDGDFGKPWREVLASIKNPEAK